MNILRKYARYCIVALWIGVIMMILGFYLENLIYLYISIASIIIGLIIKFFVLKCPYCGWGGAIPQWSKRGTIHCPKCGKALEYDE